MKFAGPQLFGGLRLRAVRASRPRLVVASSCIMYFVYLGLAYSFGIIQDHLLQASLANLSSISWIGTVGSALPLLLGIPSLLLMRRVGSPVSACISGALMASGEFSASFCTTSYVGLFFTLGVTYGIGAAIACSIAILESQRSYPRRKSSVAGLVFASGGLGATTLSLSLDKAIRVFGIASTLRYLGIAVAGLCLLATIGIWLGVEDTNNRIHVSEAEEHHQERALSFQASALHILKFRLTGSFYLVALLAFLVNFATLVPPYLIPLVARYVDTPRFPDFLHLALWNLSSSVSRIVMGLAADHISGPVSVLTLGLCLGGLSLLVIWPFVRSAVTLALFSVFNGFGLGCIFSIMPPVVAEVTSDEKFPFAWAFVSSLYSFGYLAGNPIAGTIVERAQHAGEEDIGAFRGAGWYGGSVMLACVILGIFIAVRQNKVGPIIRT